MTNFQRAAIYADLADAHVVAALDAMQRGDLDAASRHEAAASEYFQTEHEILAGVQA